MTLAQDHITDTLNRAQHCWDTMTDPLRSDEEHLSVNLFINHITSAVLLEHVHRLDPALAERLVPWLLAEDGIFSDGYAGELLFQWRAQLAAGQPMNPIAPPERIPPAVLGDIEVTCHE